MGIENRDTGNTVYGVSMPKSDVAAFRKKSQADYGIPGSQLLRILIKGFIDGRVTIAKPKNQKDIFK